MREDCPPHVLVVDDQHENRRLVEACLRSDGHAVTLAASGDEALARAREHPPDLVLLDILMPGMDGYEVCERLRNMPSMQSVPIVFLTALGDTVAYRKALDSGADDFLAKPLQRLELLLRVRSLLRIRRLGREIADNHEELRKKHEALLRAQREKDELVSFVVHDLKNPLAAIVTLAQFLEGEPGLSDPAKGSLEDILTASASMQRLIMNLLDVARGEDGTLRPRPENVRVEELFASACGMLRARAQHKRQQLSWSAPPSLAVRVDRDMITRVLCNLIENAVKYSPTGSSIRLRASPPAGDGQARLVCVDEGPGISPANRERVFEKYVRVDQGQGDEARLSRGLGLAFCRIATEANGGRIWVEAAELGGTQFCVVLPMPAFAG